MDTHASPHTMGGAPTLSREIRRFFDGGVIHWLTGLVVAWCGLYALIFLYHGVCLTLYPFDVDNSEAYLVDQGARIAQGQFLYPSLDEPPYRVDNYPPLYPMLAGLGFLWSGPNFHWPRAVSLASTLLTACLLGYWVFLHTRNKIASCMAGMIYLSFYHVNDWGALARVDALGVALAVAGIVFFEKTRKWKAALVFVIPALLTRQTLFAAPLAIFAALLPSDRKSAYWYISLLLCWCGVLAMGILALSGMRAWLHLVVYNANEFRFSDVMNYLNQWFRLYAVWGCAPLVILIWLYPKTGERENSTSPILFWYTLFAIGEALLCGKIGSAPNYLLSLVAATSVGVGLIYNRLARDSTKLGETLSLPLLFFLCASVMQLSATWHWPHSRMAFSETPSLMDGEQVRTLQNSLQRIRGPILSDRAGVALMAGCPPEFQPFILTQLSREGKWDQSGLLKRIREKTYPLVILQFNLDEPQWDRESFTPEMIDALKESYSFDRKIVRYGSGIVRYYLYRPKP